MKQNKNLVWVLLGAVVVSIAVWLVFTQKNTTLSSDSKDFSIEDTASIYSIKISDKLGNSTTLKREGGHWTVNDKWKADRRQVELLLKTIRLVEVKAPVSLKARNNVIRDMASTSITVEIFDKDGDEMKTYFVGGPAPDELGTKMLIKGAPEPMLTHIPGFNGYLTPRYPARPKDWRGSEVFVLNPSTINQVAITYSGYPEASFILDVKGNEFLLNDPSGKKPSVKLSELRSKQYLSNFRSVYWELFPPLSDKQRDSILTLPQSIKVRVKTTSGDVPLLTLFDKQADHFTKGVGNNNMDTDKFYGTYGEGSKEIFLIQITPLRDILVSYDMIRDIGMKQ